MVARTVKAELADLPGLYERMREQRLLRRVVKGGGSYAEFLAIHEQRGPLCLEVLPNGDVAGFWWVTGFYAQAVCFHACLFKPWRRLAPALFAGIRDRLFRAGATDIFVCVEDRYPDLGRFCAGAGLKEITRIGQEVVVWAAAAAATQIPS